MKRVQRAADASSADIGDLVASSSGQVPASGGAPTHRMADVDSTPSVRVRGAKTRQADRVLALSDALTERLRTRAGHFGTEGQVFGTTRFSISRKGADILGKPRDRQTSSRLSGRC